MLSWFVQKPQGFFKESFVGKIRESNADRWSHSALAELPGQSLLSVRVLFLFGLLIPVKDLNNDPSLLFLHWALGTFKMSQNGNWGNVVQVFIEARRLTINCVDSG